MRRDAHLEDDRVLVRGSASISGGRGGRTNLDGAGPLVDEAVDAQLEELVGPQRPRRHDDAVVELVQRPAPLRRPLAGRQFHHRTASLVEAQPCRDRTSENSESSSKLGINPNGPERVPRSIHFVVFVFVCLFVFFTRICGVVDDAVRHGPGTDDGGLDALAVEVDDGVDAARHARRRNALRRRVDVEHQIALRERHNR